jgi:hypothetical protein
LRSGWHVCAKRSTPSLRNARGRKKTSHVKSRTGSKSKNTARACRKLATENATAPHGYANADRHRKTLVAGDKGLPAMDEINPTCNK